jgi:GNAT superfamily N-acetyltransferase
MNIYLKHIRDDDDQVPICVAFYKSKAVGTITLTPWGDFSIFVKKSMRRKGIGTALIRQMKRLDRNATGHSLGSVAGQKFFKSIGVV